MAKQQHKAIQTQGKRIASAAQIATNTSGTYGGISNAQSNATSASVSDRDSQGYEVISVPPAIKSDNGDLEKTPLTFGHVIAGWKALWAVLVVLACGIWWLAHLSTKVDQHEDDIKVVKMQTDKLLNESASESAKLQKLDSQIGRLEDKMFQQAMDRPKK